jgi:hypothetical protein
MNGIPEATRIVLSAEERTELEGWGQNAPVPIVVIGTFFERERGEAATPQKKTPPKRGFHFRF